MVSMGIWSALFGGDNRGHVSARPIKDWTEMRGEERFGVGRDGKYYAVKGDWPTWNAKHGYELPDKPHTPQPSGSYKDDRGHTYFEPSDFPTQDQTAEYLVDTATHLGVFAPCQWAMDAGSKFGEELGKSIGES
jgi:hypothetical protein